MIQVNVYVDCGPFSANPIPRHLRRLSMPYPIHDRPRDFLLPLVVTPGGLRLRIPPDALNILDLNLKGLISLSLPRPFHSLMVYGQAPSATLTACVFLWVGYSADRGGLRI